MGSKKTGTSEYRIELKKTGTTKAPQQSTSIRALYETVRYDIFKYLLNAARLFLAYSFVLIASWGLFQLIWVLVEEDINRDPTVKMIAEFAKSGLAIVYIICAVIHGLIGAWAQIKASRDLQK